MRIECFRKSDGHIVDQVQDSGTISLDFEGRTLSRGKASASDGNEIAWFLEQGEFLRGGDRLHSEQGDQYLVQAAPEAVSRVTARDQWLLMRVAYHLGNRHVPLCVNKDELLFQPDYVLDDMVKGLGAQVAHCDLPFQPEDGAYHSHGEHTHSEHAHSEHTHE